jgi:hypothetical protein
MTSFANRIEPMPTKSVLSVCLDDSPVLGGLSRGIRDMADALAGQILSLDSGRLPPSQDDARWNIRRLDVGRGPLVSRHLRLGRQVVAAIDAAIAQSSLVVCHSLYRIYHSSAAAACGTVFRIGWWRMACPIRGSFQDTAAGNGRG